MPIQPPQEGEYNPYYHEYIGRVPEGDVLAFMQKQHAETLALLGGLSEEQASARPAPDISATPSAFSPIVRCVLDAAMRRSYPAIGKTPMLKMVTSTNVRLPICWMNLAQFARQASISFATSLPKIQNASTSPAATR